MLYILGDFLFHFVCFGVCFWSFFLGDRREIFEYVCMENKDWQLSVVLEWAVLEGKCYTCKCRQLHGYSYSLIPTKRSACSLSNQKYVFHLLRCLKFTPLLITLRFPMERKTLGLLRNEARDEAPGRMSLSNMKVLFFCIQKGDTESMGWGWRGWDGGVWKDSKNCSA